MSDTVIFGNWRGPARPRAMLMAGYPDRAIYRLWRAVCRAWQVVADAREMARAYGELAAMSDLELHDIGIGRADVPAVIEGTYRRERRILAHSVSSGRRERSPSPDHRDQSCDQGAST